MSVTRKEAGLHAIDLYDIRIVVKPLARCGQLVTALVRHGTHERGIECDNIATISRQVTFAPRTRSTSPYTLRYLTRNCGFITEPKTSSSNEASSAERARYNDYGNEVVYRFVPQPGKTYTMDFDVLKGFDPGHRNVHFHLPSDARFAKVCLTIDLSSYSANEWTVHPPQAYFSDADPSDHSIDSLLWLSESLRKARTTRRTWRWEEHKLKGGVIGAAWDVTPKDQKRALLASSAENDDLAARCDLLMNTDPYFLYQVMWFTRMAKLLDGGPSSFGDMGKHLGIDKSRLSRLVKELRTSIRTSLCMVAHDGVRGLTDDGVAFLAWSRRYLKRELF